QKWFTDLQADISNWIADVGPGRVGAILLGVIAVTVVAAQAYRRRPPRDDEAEVDQRVSAP
ncbi:MAG: hypothetical protein OES57_09070, partial [Acidimicrobiia bacterium]|nr:hypothetical protein [Acidimicrobiia bacterium]